MLYCRRDARRLGSEVRRFVWTLMTTDDQDDRSDAYHQVLTELGKLHDAWRIYRDVVNRAINLLNHEVISFQDRLDKDDKARMSRQTEIDQKLDAITRGQARLQKWQWVRIGVELFVLVVILALFIGKTWL